MMFEDRGRIWAISGRDAQSKPVPSRERVLQITGSGLHLMARVRHTRYHSMV